MPRAHINQASRIDWCTPENLLVSVRDVLGVVHLDPCANPNSTVGALVDYKLPENDGLTKSWAFKTIYVNPPFGSSYIHNDTKAILSAKEFKELTYEKEQYKKQTIKDWILRCSNTYRNFHNEVMALIPAATDTKVWQEVIFPDVMEERASICFLKGRVKFAGATAGCPMAMSMVYWGDIKTNFYDYFAAHGTVIGFRI